MMVPLPRTVRPLIQFALAGAVIALTVLYPEWRVELQTASYYLKITSGDLQTGPTDSLLPDPLVVSITSRSNGAAVPGERVSFAITQQPPGSTGAALTNGAT